MVFAVTMALVTSVVRHFPLATPKSFLSSGFSEFILLLVPWASQIHRFIEILKPVKIKEFPAIIFFDASSVLTHLSLIFLLLGLQLHSRSFQVLRSVLLFIFETFPPFFSDRIISAGLNVHWPCLWSELWRLHHRIFFPI